MKTNKQTETRTDRQTYITVEPSAQIIERKNFVFEVIGAAVLNAPETNYLRNVHTY